MVTVYIENKEGYVTGILFDCIEDIVLYTNTFGDDCKITIGEEWTNK